MGVFDFILCATAPPIHPIHAYRIAFMLITTVVLVNILNTILLRQKVFRINQILTQEDKELRKESEELRKDIKNLKCRLKKYEVECNEDKI